MCSSDLKYGIYVIDDDEFINVATQFQISQYLNSDEISIESFINPLEAIEEIKYNAAQGLKPILCIVDFQMPEITGDKLVRQIKGLFPETKFIMLSGNSSASLVSDLVDENLLDFYLGKPWDKDELLDKVNKCLPPIHQLNI